MIFDAFLAQLFLYSNQMALSKAERVSLKSGDINISLETGQ